MEREMEKAEPAPRDIYRDPPLEEYGLDTPEARAAWADWVDFRRQTKRGAWVEKTVRTQLNGYRDSPGRLAAAVEHTIKHGWAGLFEPKTGNGRAPTGAAPVRTFADVARDQEAKTIDARPAPPIQNGLSYGDPQTDY